MEPITSTDELLGQASSGDPSALVKLLRSQEPQIRAAIQARLSSRWQALVTVDDIVQHTFTDAVLQIRSFSPRGQAAFAVWIRKLAEHNAIEVIRALQAEKRGGNRKQLQLPESSDTHATLFDRLIPGRTQTTPSMRMMRDELRHSLEEALRRLPDHYRVVVQQYDLEGRPIDEIATTLGRTHGAIHLIRVRAHSRLRELLDLRSQFFQRSP